MLVVRDEHENKLGETVENEKRRGKKGEDRRFSFSRCVYLDCSQKRGGESCLGSAAAQPNRDLRQAYAESAAAAHPMRAGHGSVQ